MDNLDDFRDYFFEKIIKPALDQELELIGTKEVGTAEMKQLHMLVSRFQRGIILLTDADIWPNVEIPLNLGSVVTPAEAFGLREDHLENCYNYVKTVFEQGQYEDAADICLLLTRLAPNERAFWIALAMSEQMKGDHTLSALAYSKALELGASDLTPALYATVCLVHSGKREMAYKLLNEVLDECEGEDVEFDLRAEEMLDQLA